MNSHLILWITGAVLSFWALLSLLNQLPRNRHVRWVKSRDTFALIPSWSFFAPNPGRSDYHLLYRLRTATGGLGAWQPVELRGKAGLLSTVWNPHKRKNKALTDAVCDLAYLTRLYSRESVSLTVSHLLLAHFIGRLPHSPDAEAYQFVVIETFGYHNPKAWDLIYESPLHRLPAHA
jgi:hypothetical protein